ncbi:MAG: glutamine amidotransferase [Hyphomonadaceae bacterium]|jgi:hypothetical protein|uniref:glutamine amidotransferase n=1 Tax=Aquidulcibacter sp. TaxID=2052990 RepID=UPI0022C406B1|nr:glutamine amidotransferase [Aquidulcibacter sp.]MCZ8206869.1 glutamine amidotransferase [Aquidulcibacter sp.]
MNGNDLVKLGFDPWLPPLVLLGLAILGLGLVALYLRLGGKAPLTRLCLVLVALIGLSGPSQVREERLALTDIVSLLVDRSESMALTDRAAGAEVALRALKARLGQIENLEVRITYFDGSGAGTALSSGLDQAFADIPPDRVAGAIVISDGRFIDGEDAARPFPIHQILVGSPQERDRRIDLRSAPKQAPIGEITKVVVRVEDSDASVPLTVRVGTEAPQTLNVPTGEDIVIEVPIAQRGLVPIAIETPGVAGEVSTANNGLALSITGVRDRLRVMLVTGQPYAGSRAWRNLLKSDPSVDLIQFTILRPPEKQDFTPTEELSLIPFPTRELFLDKIDSFDLVVFDRFSRLSVLPDAYLDSVAQWVEGGGAFLMLAGPSEGLDEGVQSTPLKRILPVQSRGEPIETAFRPALTERGRSHPVSASLAEQSNSWGQWLRVQPSTATGDVLLEGAGEPLLVLGQVGRGRVAAVMSDQAWLWRRGYDGGGPFDELFRRTAHWLMKEADLEADRLLLRSQPGRLLIERQSSHDPGPAQVTLSGQTFPVPLSAAGNGVWRGESTMAKPGLVFVQSGDKSAFIVAGIGNPNEARLLTADPTALAGPQAKQGGGSVTWVGKAGTGPLPDIARLGKSQKAGAEGLGLRRAGATSVTATSRDAILPPWAYAILLAALALWAWWREGRLVVYRPKT